MADDGIHFIPLKQIDVDDLNVRKKNPDEKIDELAENIKLYGLMQPIVLHGTFGHPPYKVLLGQRRYLAHEFLGKKEIAATFTGKIDDNKAILMSLSENMLRVELNHADKATAITTLYKDYFGKNVKKVAQALGIREKTVREYLDIEELASTKVKDLLRKSKISKVDAKRIIDAAQGNKHKADSIADNIGKLNTYEKNRLVQYSKEKPAASASELIEEAKKPKVQETIMLQLPKEVTKAARIAAKELSLDMEALALNALTEWLKTNSYLK